MYDDVTTPLTYPVKDFVELETTPGLGEESASSTSLKHLTIETSSAAAVEGSAAEIQFFSD